MGHRFARTLQGRQRYRGSLYVMILGGAMTITVLGMWALMAARMQSASAYELEHATVARQNALDGVELALHWMQLDEDWRANYPDVRYGQTGSRVRWETYRTQLAGTVKVKAVDPGDDDLSNFDSDTITITSTGTRLGVSSQIAVTVQPVVSPISSMLHAIHAAGDIEIKSGNTVTLDGSTISTNGNLVVDGELAGNAVARTQSGSGITRGTTTISAVDREQPASDVIAKLKELATEITLRGDLNNVVLGPGVNTYSTGQVSSSGIYYMRVTGKNVTIENTRVYGTLIVQLSTKSQTVTVKGAANLANNRTDMPALIIERGNLALEMTAARLDEAPLGVNFNPSPGRYDTDADNDTSDEYVSEIRGLVYCEGDVAITAGRLVGSLICDGKVTVNGSVYAKYLTELATSPPLGFSNVTGYRTLQNSWDRPID